MMLPLPVIALLWCGLLIGLVPTLVDGLRTALGQRFELTARRADQVPSLFYLSWLPGMPVAGWLADHWIASQNLLFDGLLGVALGLAWLALARTVWGVVSSLVVLGFAYSALSTAAIHAMPSVFAFDPSRVAALNLGFVPIGLGALVGPWLVGRLERRGSTGLLLLALGMLVPAALVALSPNEAFPRLTASTGLLQNSPQVGLVAAALLLYFVIENCLDIWPQPYLQQLGHSPRGVNFGLTAFWSAFLLARLVFGLFGPERFEAWLLPVLALCAAFFLGNLVGAYGSSSGSLGFWAVGFCYGPLLPGALALVPDVCPDLPATALGALLALSGLDTLLFRPFLVALSQKHPARTVMRLPTLIALVLAAPLLVLALLRG